MRVRSRLDLRSLGAACVFWDATRPLEVETLPLPPSFEGSGSSDLDLVEHHLAPHGLCSSPHVVSPPSQSCPAQLVLRWNSRFTASGDAPCSYQLLVWSPSARAFVRAYSGTAGSVDLLDRASLPRAVPVVRPGQCLAVRLVRASCSPLALAAQPAAAAVCVALAAPLPPCATWIDEAAGRVRLDWDGSCDVSLLPEGLSLAKPASLTARGWSIYSTLGVWGSGWRLVSGRTFRACSGEPTETRSRWNSR